MSYFVYGLNSARTFPTPGLFTGSSETWVTLLLGLTEEFCVPNSPDLVYRFTI